MKMRDLYALGFAVHLLHPKSKRPIDSGWTKRPREDFNSLSKRFKKGMNLGVRLGQVSKVGGGYLAVIDCDVKSEVEDHRNATADKLKELFGPAVFDWPRVETGRGNGSCHIYVTTKEAIRFKELARSKDVVKVKMPSADKPSKREVTDLTIQEVEDGIRLRPAWSISVMGEGQQVVLPPSVHPDTGKAYTWGVSPVNVQIPLVDIAGQVSTSPRVAPDVLSPFAAVDDFSLMDTNLPSDMIDLIMNGGGCGGDRSASLFKATLAMLRYRFTTPEILTVLTDEAFYLGTVAYEHAKTSSRKIAAAWLEKYTIRKCAGELKAERDFDTDVVETPLAPEAAAAQKVELVKSAGWEAGIERTRDKESRPKNTFKNVELILKNAVGPDLFRKNEFSSFEIYGRVGPWGGRVGANITDIDIVLIKRWFSHTYRFEPASGIIHEVVQAISNDNKFHPVRDYLDGLRWDGVERLGSWLKDAIGAEAPEPYLSDVSRKLLIALVARIYEPGCKFDQVVILEGGQGVGKSTLLRQLIGDEWFSDEHLVVSDKDAVVNMQGVWCFELGELSSFHRAEINQLKAFLSRTADKIRLPYGRRTEVLHRQCVFVGTTNLSEYLQDETGNRRFWPVKVGRYDFKWIKENRDQLFAEAKFHHQLGEVLYLEDRQTIDQAINMQRSKLTHDSWSERWADFVRTEMQKAPNERFNLDEFSMSDLFETGRPFADQKDDIGSQRRVGRVLRISGYTSVTSRHKTGYRKVWRKTVTHVSRA